MPGDRKVLRASSSLGVSVNPPIIFVPPRRSVERRGLMWEYQVLEPITDPSRGSFGWVGRRWTRRGAEKAADKAQALLEASR